MPADLVRSWNPRLAGVTVFNWAAIHPPGYHVLAVPFLLAARAGGADLEGEVRVTRLFSAVCGAAALLVFFLVLREAGADEATALAGIAGVAAIPMYAHMSAGVSHDIGCALAGAVAALFWIRFLRTREVRDALDAAAGVAAAGAVKATAVPLALALLLQMPVLFRGRVAARLARTIAAAAVAFSTTAAWALWRGTPPGSEAAPAAASRPAASALPVAAILDQTFRNFFGLIGWTGAGKGEVAWVQVSGAFLAPYLLLAAGLAAGAALWVRRLDARAGAPPGAAAGWTAAAAVLLAAGVAGAAAAGPIGAGALVLAASPLAAAALSLPRVWRARPLAESAVFSSQFAFLVFAAAYLEHTAANVLRAGTLRGTHGRYFFVVLAFLLPAFVLPAADAIPRRAARTRLLALAVAVLLADGILFYALRVLPLYARAGSAP